MSELHEPLYVCGLAGPFPITALRAPQTATGHPAFGALREELHRTSGPRPTRWWVLSTAGERVTFANGAPPVLETATCERGPDGWRMISYASNAAVERYRAGGRVARWYLADEPAPDATVLDVFVREQSCASGRSAEGRIEQPELEYCEDTISVAVFVTPLPGPQQCPGNPLTPFRVELGEPLRGRTLLDGGVHPAQPVALRPVD